MNRLIPVAVASTLLIITIPVFASNLTGPYLGGSIALSNSFSANYSEDSGVSGNFSVSETLSSADLVAGYSFVTASNIYTAFEASYTFGGPDEEVLSDGTNRIELAKDDAFGVKAKLGFAVNDKSAVYGILGYSRVEAELTATTSNLNVSDSDDFNGYTTGIGGAYSVTDNVNLTVEGTYTDYDKEEYNSFSFDPEETRVTLGLAYQFNI